MRAVLVLTACMLLGCDSALTDAGCALDTPDHEIEVKRDLAVDFSNAPKLKVEACATREGQSPTCTTAIANADGSLGTPEDAAHGKLVRTADGKTRLELVVHLGEGEPDSTTVLVVKVLDETDKELLKAEGDIHWSDDACNRKPDKRSI